MRIVQTASAAALIAIACSAPEKGAEPHDGGKGDADAASDGDADVMEVSDPCGPLMFKFGSVCIDKQPALHADGSQGAAVSWTEAVTICEARGARLCTEAEREAACPDGQVSLNTPANGFYCGGPASTWEWSSAPCSNNGHCLSPCCNATAYPCVYTACTTDLVKPQSYRCCKSL